MTGQSGRQTRRQTTSARRRRLLARSALGAAALALVLLLLYTVGPLGTHLQRPGKPPLGYLRAPLGGRHYRVTAWSLGDAASLRAAVAARAVDEVDFDWYHAQGDGTVRAQNENLDLVAQAVNQGLNVFATVTNSPSASAGFSHATAAAVLASPAVRRRLIDNLVALVEEKGYDGIDLDWEALKAADRDRFSAFVEDLAAALHAKHRFLSLAVFPKTSEPGAWDNQISADYRRLGRAADEFKIMTYSFSGPWSSAGPQAPLEWVTRVLDFAAKCVPAKKISMGVPLFGFDWHGGTAVAVTAKTGAALAARAGVAVERDAASQEAIARFTDANGVSHTVYYQDKTALRAKLDHLRQHRPKLAGISIWVMGQEAPGFWSLIEQRLRAPLSSGQ